MLREDVPPPSLCEVITFISDSWEYGLQENARELLGQVQKLILERAAGGAKKSPCTVAGEHADRLLLESHASVHGAEEPHQSEEENECDAGSTVWSDLEYTVRSVRSIKERTQWFFRRRTV